MCVCRGGGRAITPLPKVPYSGRNECSDGQNELVESLVLFCSLISLLVQIV